MWAVVGSVTGAVAAVSVTLGKTKLGGLVRHQCVMATGTDLTWTQCHIAEGGYAWKIVLWMEKIFFFLLVCAYVNRCCIFFFKLAASRGDNSWDTSNQPQCMCDTCFFIQSSCLFIFCHNQNASCYFLPSSVQTNNRCERLEHILPSPLPLVLCCDYSMTTFAVSLSRLLSLSIVSLKPAHPSSAMWGQEAAPISHPFPIPFFWHFLDLNILCGTCIILLYLCRGITLSMHWIIYGNDKSTCLRRTIVSSSSFCISLGQIIRFPWNSYGKYS